MWPTTKACVIEVAPQSLLERGVDGSYLNLDTDYAIEYEVDGRKYLEVANIESNVRVGGFKIARTPSIPREFQIRYNAQNPSEYSILHVYSPVLSVTINVAFVVIGILMLTLDV